MSTVSAPVPSPSRGARSQLVLALAVVGVALFGLTSLVTGAFFTDSKTVDNNTFSTGTVSLGTNPTTAAFTASNMAPGDTVVAPITVSNTGSLSERYALLSTTTEASLSAQLQMTVKTGFTAANCTSANFGASGTTVYGAGVLGSTGGTKVLGDAAQGNQTGDRTLAAGANEVLCFQVTLPTSTGNTYQNKTTTAALKFDSEQTTNNP